ncbi:MAG: T9SS type A sorting domain-containing protein, partial [Saprospiraceae bacterium]|nr:T9SS type A sorting domain-containing protein [Saprospiraceae bacterium]
LVVEATEVVKLSEVATINSQITSSEFYSEGKVEGQVSLQFVDTEFGESQFELLQNRPNPFIDKTNIRFILPQDMEANIAFFDVNGKVLKEIRGDFAKGRNSVRITAEELGVPGVVYYQLTAGDLQYIRKMIVQ